MKVYIVRHGQVPHNALHQYNTTDEDLTEYGVSQAVELSEKVKNMHFDIIISSPLIRAKHTAEIIVNNREIFYDDRIKERSCGSLSGQLLEVTNREEYWNYYTTIQYGTSENIQKFFKRVYNFLDELKTKENKLEFNTYCIFTKEEQEVKETIGLIFKDYIENLKVRNK